MKLINNKLIRSFHPCYDPSTKGIPNDENLSVMEWVDKYRGVIRAEDILWLLLREEFYDDRQLRLFSVWCAREALKLVSKPSQISIDACNVAEKFSKGEATEEELAAARATARAAARATARDAASAAASVCLSAIGGSSASSAARATARDAARFTEMIVKWSDESLAERANIMASAWSNERVKQLNYLLTL